ncbi:helix-hairpin-helix domain-containing protein [Actinomadura chibensis]|nr:helix-hairpin-helix domain-containing protein [Actinomadura chibensis]
MAEDRAVRRVVGYAWALSPTITLGLATPVTMGYAALRTRSAWVWATVVFYFVLVASMLLPVDETSFMADGGFILALLLSGPAATIQAFALKARVFPEPALPGTLEHAVQEAERRRRLRARAVEIARATPELAVELGIGRPDLERSFDDGGVVDVNHAPAPALRTVPGLTQEHVRRIVRLRRETGGFTSAEELAMLADLPPHLTPVLKKHAVFLPD